MSAYLEVAPSDEELGLDLSKATKGRFASHGNQEGILLRGPTAQNYCIVKDPSKASQSLSDIGRPAKITTIGLFK